MPPIPPPPRRIRATHPMPTLKFIGRFFLLLVFLIEAVLLAGLIHEGILRGLGHQTQAQLISIHETKDASSTYHHKARYTYSLPGGQPRTDESQISYSAWHRLHKPFISGDRGDINIVFPTTAPTAAEIRAAGELGAKGPQKLDIFAYSLGPISFSRAVEHEWALFFWLIPVLFAPVVGFLCFVLYLAMIIRPRRVRWLYTHGTPIMGIIIEQRRVHSRHGGEILFVFYAYTPPGADRERIARVMVNSEDEFQAAALGKQALILYNPAKPKRSTLYDYGGYVWE